MNHNADVNKHQPAVGIDLGTTYSVVAYLDSTGRPATILNGAGELLTPSAVLFDEGDIVVGKEAAKASVVAPDAYADCFKRDMGGIRFRRNVRGIEVPPEVLSAFILERLKQDAERRLGPVRQVVITVPAFFDETRRRATQDAGRLAGLEVLDIINEPTAAALAYGFQHGFFADSSAGHNAGPMRVLVHDLGGGTFDVTILEINGTQFRALATDGDVQLGGKDFDERLVDYLAEKFREAHGVDPRSDPQDAAQLWLDAQQLKHTLSERSKANVVCFHAGIRLRLDVTREQFEDLTRDLLERTETTTSLVVKEAGLDWSKIDRVLLVGGSSRMPMVAEMLARVTGKQPDRSASPDEAVAHGAALYAGMLMQQAGDSAVSKCQLINVNSHSLGVVGLDGKTKTRVNVVLIPKNSPLPSRAVRTFQTARPDQRSVKVSVVEGESHRPEECIPLGECVVRDLEPGLPKGTAIQVEYSYASNGRISVSARIPQSRQSAHVELQRGGSHTLENLETWRARLSGREPSSGRGFSPSDSVALVDPKDRGSVMRRLDALYTKIGKAVANVALPKSLSRSQQAAQEAAASLNSARTILKEAEIRKQSAAGGAESVHVSSQLAQAKTHVEQANTQAEFAFLVLGRDCGSAGVKLAGLEPILKEIAELKKGIE